ncbi:glycosyltransferase [Nocardioides sp. MAHUQ-72]|uniref:glycosyltransferase n=1 Tax=unclassified Nocardioides TaxID=2615069 RepID=UPI0036117AD8
MKILVHPHLMEIGGSQLNAIELAARVAGRGHEVVLFSPRGPLVRVAEELGLEVVHVPHDSAWPSPLNSARLRQLVAERGIEVVHGYEFGPALDLAFGVEPFGHVGGVTTVMSMSVPHFLPRHSTMVVGTAALLAQRATEQRGPLWLMEPPVDVDVNASRDQAGARARFGIAPHEVVVSVVCRMTTDLDKLAGVITAVDVVADLASKGAPLRLLAVGEGPGLPELRRAADEARAATGRETVIVTGGLLDPSDAYDAADLVLGMGSSALKGLAFGKPLVVQGAQGYWRLLDESTLPEFLGHGWYGEGGRGAEDLIAAMEPLVRDPASRRRLGCLGRRLAVERFSLDSAADLLETIYAEAASRRTDRSVLARELLRTSYEFAKFCTVRFGQEHVQPRRVARVRDRQVVP